MCCGGSDPEESERNSLVGEELVPRDARRLFGVGAAAPLFGSAGNSERECETQLATVVTAGLHARGGAGPLRGPWVWTSKQRQRKSKEGL